MPLLKFRTKSGGIAELPVEELLEVDGKAFGGVEKTSDLALEIAHLAGRVTTLENVLYQREGEPETTQ